jgi:hypothetical protein
MLHLKRQELQKRSCGITSIQNAASQCHDLTCDSVTLYGLVTIALQNDAVKIMTFPSLGDDTMMMLANLCTLEKLSESAGCVVNHLSLKIQGANFLKVSGDHHNIVITKQWKHEFQQTSVKT